jgi:hypothetical protein
MLRIVNVLEISRSWLVNDAQVGVFYGREVQLCWGGTGERVNKAVKGKNKERGFHVRELLIRRSEIGVRRGSSDSRTAIGNPSKG